MVLTNIALKTGLFSLDFKWCLKTRPFDIRTVSHDLEFLMFTVHPLSIVQ
jgi:hypothetical protein